MKTTTFLKKYSTIDQQFIDDFYSFYDSNKNEYDFIIDLDKMAKWLDTKKDNIKRLLIANFIENQDYIQTGKNKKIILLTYECAKLLTMISRTKKADIIRKYHIEIEKLLINYKDIIIESLNRKIGIKLKK